MVCAFFVFWHNSKINTFQLLAFAGLNIKIMSTIYETQSLRKNRRLWLNLFVCVLYFWVSALNKVQAQLPLQNIPCTGCTVNASTGYATAAAAVAATGSATTNYTLNPNTIFTQCATVKTDPNGTVGIIDLIMTTQPTGNTICLANTAASRKGSLYLASGANCTGPEIQALRKGSNSSTFNPEYVGLAPNTNYIMVIQTTVDGSCTQYQSSSVKYYGAVTPQFTFNCSVSSSTGTFIAGTSSSGTLTVGISGATAGTATFNVSGTDFTGTLATTLTAGQTSVTIPITYGGTGAVGSRTLTVTSSNGGGTCSSSVSVVSNLLCAGNGQVDYSKWTLAGLGSSDAWYNQSNAATVHLNPATKNTKYGDIPGSTLAPTTTGTVAVNMGTVGSTPFYDEQTGAPGHFVQIEGYMLLPCFTNSIKFQVLNSGTGAGGSSVRENYSSLHLAVSGGLPTTNSSDLMLVAKDKTDFAGTRLDTDPATGGVQNLVFTLSNNGASNKWVRFADVVSNGTQRYGSIIQWSIDGGAFVNIPASVFQSISGAGSNLVCSNNACLDTDSDGVPDSTDLDDDNDGILDKIEKNCGINQTWTSLGSGVWQSNLTPSLKVKVTLGNYPTAWSSDIALTNFNRACTEASYTSDYAPIVNTNLPAFQFNKTVGASVGTITVEYLDASNTPVTIKNPRFHLGGLGGSASGVVASSDWTLQGGKTMTTLSKDATDFGTTPTTIFHPRLGQASGTVNDCASGEGSGTLQMDGSMSSFSFSVKANGGFFDQMVMAFEACVDADTDNDGIANYLDLDSDGDGCPDAIEGGANFAASTLVTSTLAGGNSGTGYTGTSTSPVTKNLGNTVGSTTTTLGVPTVATTGQTIGNSANKLVQSANCPVACLAGTTAPAITATTATNTCPTTTVSLAGLANTGTKPTGTTLIWSTHKIPTSLGDTLTNLTTVSTAGKYYALYFDKVNSCYSPADSVVVSLTVCANNPPAQSGLISQAKTGTASTELTPTGGNGTYVYSVDNSASCTPVSGATALPSTSNLTVTNSATGAYTYTTPATAGVYYFCIKVCDTSTPTPNCVTKTYTVTVTATPVPFTTSNPPNQTAMVNDPKTGTASADLVPMGGNGTYVYSLDNTASCTPLAGATALPSGSNLTVTNSATGAYTYTAPPTVGIYYYCIKVCDTTTPTPTCATKTYKLTVTAPAGCPIGTVTPGIK